LCCEAGDGNQCQPLLTVAPLIECKLDWVLLGRGQLADALQLGYAEFQAECPYLISKTAFQK